MNRKKAVMGSPVSAIVANLYMEFFEETRDTRKNWLWPQHR